MPRTEDILSTLRMVKEEHLDVRTITMGISLTGCVDRDLRKMCAAIRNRIVSVATGLADTCATVSARYDIPIVNRRLAVTPIARIADGHGVARNSKGSRWNCRSREGCSVWSYVRS